MRTILRAAIICLGAQGIALALGAPIEVRNAVGFAAGFVVGILIFKGEI